MGFFGRHTCPSCGASLSALRMPRNARQLLWGGATCPQCGAESDRRGRPIVKKQ